MFWRDRLDQADICRQKRMWLVWGKMPLPVHQPLEHWGLLVDNRKTGEFSARVEVGQDHFEARRMHVVALGFSLGLGWRCVFFHHVLSVSWEPGTVPVFWA